MAEDVPLRGSGRRDRRRRHLLRSRRAADPRGADRGDRGGDRGRRRSRSTSARAGARCSSPSPGRACSARGRPRAAGSLRAARPARARRGRGCRTLEEAGPRVVERYLGVYGPAAEAALDDWLLRGVTPKKVLRGWFARSSRGGRDRRRRRRGRSAAGRAPPTSTPWRRRTSPTRVRLLPAFDQYVLGPGTKDPHILDPAPARATSAGRRAGSRPSSSLPAGSAVPGRSSDGAVRVALFAETPPST